VAALEEYLTNLGDPFTGSASRRMQFLPAFIDLLSFRFCCDDLQIFLLSQQKIPLQLPQFSLLFSMPKISVVDISDSNKIQELLDDDNQQISNDLGEDSDAESDDSELGVVPRILFSTFSTLTLLVPLVSVHVALDIIVHQQYAQEFDVVEIAARAGTASLGRSY
jgi:hypothetical protein